MPTRPKKHKGKADAIPQHMPRETAAQRGYGWRWQKAREGWLRAHPLCVRCEARGLVVVGTDVDHIVPHKGDMELFWDRTNWQTLCGTCHDTKTATEDGGFGRVSIHN